VLLSNRLVDTDGNILSVSKRLICKNGKNMLIISVRLVVIFNNYLSVAIYNSLVTKDCD